MSQVKLAAQFKAADQPMNGFADADFVARVLEAADRGETVEGYAVVRYKGVRVAHELEDHSRIPTFKFVGAEPLGEKDGALLARAKDVYDEKFYDRTGKRPDELEQEPLFGVDGAVDDGEREVPEADGAELLAEHRERKAREADSNGAG